MKINLILYLLQEIILGSELPQGYKISKLQNSQEK